MFSSRKKKEKYRNDKGSITKHIPINDEDSSLRNLIKLLKIYANIDSLTAREKFTPVSPHKKATNFLKKLLHEVTNVPSKIRNLTSKSIENVEIYHDISLINKDMLFFILNVTTEEFHRFFMDFYSLFDEEKDYLLSKSDFQFIINYMGSPENMGKQKMNLSLKLLLTHENYLKGALDKFSRFFVSQGESVVAPDVFNDLFEELKDEKTWVLKGDNREYFIDFLKFLPILMSYFFEFMKRRIEIRRDNLIVIYF